MAHTAPLVRALAQLALIERGVIRPASRRAQYALRIGRLSLARRLIVQHLRNPELSPPMIASLLGISVRHLHMLFEMAERSFSQAVTEERLKEARRLLIEAPERLIADVAQACGFESLATFYRAFNTACGMTPGRLPGQRHYPLLDRPIGAKRRKVEIRPVFGQNAKLFRVFPRLLH